MLGGSRLRASVGVLAAVTASLALAAGAGASSSDPAVIQAQDACDPVSFNAAGIPCARIDGSGRRVTIDDLFAAVVKDHAQGAWRGISDDEEVKAGLAASARG